MKLIFTGIALCLILQARAQYVFKAVINTAGQGLSGATVTWENQGKSFVADSTGLVTINGIPAGAQIFSVSHVGFVNKQTSYSFPLPSDSIVTISLDKEEAAESEVVISATRTSRTISNSPTRTEVISGEELDEKGNMKPGDIRMLLNESTGIQTQQTSATSYNSSIRIQGLDGRYTQILKDGFPLYSGFSGGLSLTQIAPLDLKQVEVIKGSSSTLYGGGAIAGLVNLVSKVPTEKRELNFIANGTSAKGLDVSGFYSQKFNKIGVTVFGSRNSGNAYDPAGIGLTAIPEFRRNLINPRIFMYGQRTSANIGVNYVTENRTGGSINYIKNGMPGYFEQNKTGRFTAQGAMLHRFGEYASVNIKASYSYFDRAVTIPSYIFSGTQQAGFSELSYNHQGRKMQWIIGTNVLTDDFRETDTGSILRNYHHNTIGAFLQNTWVANSLLTVEAGLRGDYVKQYGFEFLPRISALLKITPQLTARIGGGSGYKTPTVFNEESEKIQFRNVLPIDQVTIRDERSVGTNLDINYRVTMGGVGVSVNQLFFYTKLNRPLLLSANLSNLGFTNANGHIDTRGLETNVKLSYNDFKLFIGYTYADVNTHFDNVKSWLPLTARHRLNNVLVYEQEGKIKLGLEAYYFSPQKLTDHTTGRAYWMAGFMAEKLWKQVAVFINFENFTDTRQTKFDLIFTGPIDNPVFKDIYAPVDGFVINGGIKVKL